MRHPEVPRFPSWNASSRTSGVLQPREGSRADDLGVCSSARQIPRPAGESAGLRDDACVGEFRDWLLSLSFRAQKIIRFANDLRSRELALSDRPRKWEGVEWEFAFLMHGNAAVASSSRSIDMRFKRHG